MMQRAMQGSRRLVAGRAETPPGAGCTTCAARTHALCAPLDAEALSRLERHVQPMRLASNEALVHEGDPVDRVYTVTRGLLRAVRYLADGRRQITEFFGRGDFIGLTRSGAHPASVEAVVASDVCGMSRAGLDDLLARFPTLKDRMLAFTVDDLERAHECQVSLGRRNPVEKVAAFLLDMADRSAALGEPTQPLRLPMTRADIADYLGLTIETVSRSFTRLRQEGVIRLPASHLVDLCRRERLEGLAGRS
jgi:CRP/FNR family transcriptional regulator